MTHAARNNGRAARAVLPASLLALAASLSWRGSPADAHSFLDEALDLARPDSGERLRAHVALHLARNAGTRQALLLARAGFTWEAIKPALDALIVRYPDSCNVNVARTLACVSDVPSRGRPCLQRLQGRVQPLAWFDDPWYVGQCAQEAGVVLPGHAPLVGAADDAT